MTHTTKYYDEKLVELDLTMYVSLDNLKASYPQYKVLDTAEYSKIYFKDSANVEADFHKLYELQNQIILDSTHVSKSMEKNNQIIERLKKNFGKQKTRLHVEENKTLAAKPREQDYANQLSQIYTTTSLLSIGILGALFICYRNFNK